MKFFKNRLSSTSSLKGDDQPPLDEKKSTPTTPKKTKKTSKTGAEEQTSTNKANKSPKTESKSHKNKPEKQDSNTKLDNGEVSKKKRTKSKDRRKESTEATSSPKKKTKSKKANSDATNDHSANNISSNSHGKKKRAASSPAAEKKKKKKSKKKKPEPNPIFLEQDNLEGANSFLGSSVDVLITQDGQKKVTKEDFELLTVVGKGSFGKVMQVKHKDSGNIYAMKVLRKEAIIQRKQVNHTKSEKNILQKIQHAFIVKLYYAFQTKEKLYMVMDYVNGGELFFHLKKSGRFSEERVRIYAAEITLALLHLHSLGIVYRDLKPENILLDCEGHVVITDFGLSKEIDDAGTHTFCGTPEYLAPEVLKGKGHGLAVDWWSLGTLLYEMLTGLPPFYSQNIGIMYQKVLNSELRFPPYLSDNVKSLLSGLLTREVDQRLGSNGQDIKAHPWFASIDWDKLYRKEVDPPFKPQVQNVLDTSQIDPLFTSERAQDSYVDSVLSESLMKENEFNDFSMVNESVMSLASNVS